MIKIENNGRCSIITKREDEYSFDCKINHTSSTFEQPFIAVNFSAEGKAVGGKTMTKMEVENLVKIAKENTAAVNDNIKSIDSITGRYQEYIILMNDFKAGTVTASDAFSKLTDLYNSGVISIDEYINSNDKLNQSLSDNAFPDKIKYTQSYIDQMSQSFDGLNQLLDDGQITAEEWVSGLS